MGSILPRLSLEKIGFCENHIAPFQANAVAIGTTAAAVTDLQTKTTAARDAYNAQQAAMQVAKAATSAYHEAVRTMAGAASDIIKQVKAKAAAAGAGGTAIYNLAQIPAPGLPSPVPPPGQPDNFTATLDRTGVLHLGWRCVNPPGAAGTIYQVARQLGTSGGFQIIGATGSRKFDDPSVPAGTAVVTYRVTPLRSTVAGPANEFTVKFGATDAGAVTAMVVQPAPKLAA